MDAQKKALVAVGVGVSVIGFGLLVYRLRQAKAKPRTVVTSTPDDPRLPSGSPVIAGKQGASVGPSPFDPVDIGWKRTVAPEWWPF